MLDAFIIDRIRREREKGLEQGLPVQVDLPVPQPERQPRQPLESEAERGIIDVDFSI